MNVSFSIASFQPQSEATIYFYGIPQDEAARTGIGSEEIAQSSFTRASAEFSRPFPPYSVTVIVLSVSPGSAGRAATGEGSEVNSHSENLMGR
jgi:hypothetical protein